MGFVWLAWLFVLVVALHNLEEAIWLPAWSPAAGRWHHPVGNSEFRFAVLVLTLLAAGAAELATLQGKGSLGAYLVTGYALAMLLNVLFPHLLATLVLRRYMPGTATAVLLNMPVTIALLESGIREGYIELHAFAIYGSLVVVGIVSSIPILFWIGRKWSAAS
ncbi:MAG: HXXEE domain-containing protein [Hyphomicrobiaceae bacterium]